MLQGLARAGCRRPRLAVLLALLAVATPTLARETPAIRYSIAISGGASMGAYEAGLNWGALRFLRRFGQNDPATGSESRPALLASVAGASAGSINTILSGLIWCNRPEAEGGLRDRLDDNLFRDVWLGIDINDLLPPQPDSLRYGPGDGLLSRANLTQAAEHLRRRWREPRFRPGCRLPLGVTVTRVEPTLMTVDRLTVYNQRFAIPFELTVQDDGRIRWGFDPGRYAAQQDLAMLLLPTRRGEPPGRIDGQAVEKVALTSAAFPIAFGRMRLRYCRLTTEAVPQPEPDTTGTDDWQCPDGYVLEEAEFADGGLFDNIPLGLARKLAEGNTQARQHPLPVNYLYLDPDPERRTPSPDTDKSTRCNDPAPPAACREMTFGLLDQGSLLAEAYGTARKYELFREIASDRWRLNLAVITNDLLRALNAEKPRSGCAGDLPWFGRALPCNEALQSSLRLLQSAYVHSRLPVAAPFDVRALERAGIARDCRQEKSASGHAAVCAIRPLRLRQQIGRALLALYRRSDLEQPDLARRIRTALASAHNDRRIHVTRRGGPITGTLLGGFGAFIDRKFREYDYYVGIYDAVVLVSTYRCSSFYTRREQPDAWQRCFNATAERAWRILDIESVPRARYVFARLAQDEFANEPLLAFARNMPSTADTDMAIIHDALRRTRQATAPARESLGMFAVERDFFHYLREHGFQPTPATNRASPVLAGIMADPEQWSHEFTRRATTRLVLLEEQADRIAARREPDPERRPPSLTPFVAATAHMLQTGTYKYPAFDFSPSTAPKRWFWRNIIPYELAFDLGGGDFLLTWQPTWRLANRHTLAARIALGLQGGLLGRRTDATGNRVERNNYLAAGLDYTWLTGNAGLSGWGITPTVYHRFDQPTNGEQTTFGGDLHVGFLKNRLRVGIGVRDSANSRDTWFLQVGVADIPGLVYWLTR